MKFDDPIAQIIHDVIESLPMEKRLYPDLYADDVAAAIKGTQ